MIAQNLPNWEGYYRNVFSIFDIKKLKTETSLFKLQKDK